GAQPPLLFVAPYISAETADRCRDLKLFFLDGAGNGYIDVPGLYIFITGRKRPAYFFQEERGRITNPAALRVVFAILCQQEYLNATYRDIADAARVALGTIGPVMKDLEARKYVAVFGTEVPKRKLVDPERLLREWVTVYPAALRPKLKARRFRAPDLKWADTADLRQHGAYWGGEMAAKRITRYLQPETATIYVTRQPTQLIADQRLRADANGNVEILDVFWNADRIPHEPDLVPPLLAYADLLATTEGRNLEAAKLIFDGHIGPILHRTT
ncbi:MAG TPA: type IV toxin-antitoxin system AbiEi family antitoxin, partial [Desulfomonilaceae bacterium]|nr:type IV toxin-antitoxin system AbiEi family antitoxin [Desulfomonilaceae bacterium]